MIEPPAFRSRGDQGPTSLPPLIGELSQKHERKETGGGGEIKEFVGIDETKQVFSSGIRLLESHIEQAKTKHSVSASIARIRLRSKGIAKSHRHETFFQYVQVIGVDKPGELITVVTPKVLRDLKYLIRGASERQLRQLSAIESIEPYTPSIKMGEKASVVTLFGGHLDDGSSLEESGVQTFDSMGIKLEPYGKLVHKYVAKQLPPDETINTMPWVRNIRPVLRLRALARIGTNPVRIIKPQNLNGPLPTPIVGIIDSGVDITIPWLSRLVVKQDSHIPAIYHDLNHGTLVGALAVSDGSFDASSTTYPPPIARLLDIQVIGSGPTEEIDEDALLVQLENAVQLYGPMSHTRPNLMDESVVVWNLSMSTGYPADEVEFSSLAHELDRICRENKVIFTVAAGNYGSLPLRGWDNKKGPDIFPNGEDRISAPGDSALSITVGSLSDTSNTPSAAPADCPSPFSRRGPGPGMLVKPDVVHYGGTCDKSGQFSGLGIVGPCPGGGWQSNIGTSFAAPRVAAQLAKLLSALPNPEPELLKILLLLSCHIKGAHNIEKRESVNYYGFGAVEDSLSALQCQPWESIILLKGELRPGYSLVTLFPFPSRLTSNGLHRGHIRMALVYEPWLDPSKGSEYCQTNVSASLGRVFDFPKEDKRPRYRKEIPTIPEEHGVGHQLERDLILHGWKWSPTKVYERTFTRLLVHDKELGWRLSVELLLRNELEPYRDQVRQPFWLGILISDPDQKENIYQEIAQELSVMGLAAPIQLRPHVQIR